MFKDFLSKKTDKPTDGVFLNMEYNFEKKTTESYSFTGDFQRFSNERNNPCMKHNINNRQPHEKQQNQNNETT